MGMKEILTYAAWICSSISTIAAAIILIVKPVREKVLGIKSEDEGIKCLLRSDMLRTYYKHREEKTIRQYEYENFMLEYKAYIAKGGNTFIKHVKKEIDEWEVLS